jgi:hypothetical protein
MTNMNRFQHEGDANKLAGINLVLPDERPARRARLTAAEVLDMFGAGTASSAESRPFSSPWLLSDSQY